VCVTQSTSADLLACLGDSIHVCHLNQYVLLRATFHQMAKLDDASDRVGFVFLICVIIKNNICRCIRRCQRKEITGNYLLYRL
jgi:hypothetical protein